MKEAEKAFAAWTVTVPYPTDEERDAFLAGAAWQRERDAQICDTRAAAARAEEENVHDGDIDEGFFSAIAVELTVCAAAIRKQDTP